MREITDNPYILNINRRFGEYTLNSYLFGEFVSEKAVSVETLLAALRELLSTLGFGIAYMGYEFLVKIVAYYLTETHDNIDDIIFGLAELYGIDAQMINDNVKAILDINDSFAARANKLLLLDVKPDECKRISTAVMIIGAIFKTYYNYNITDGNIADGINTVNYLKVILDGK